MQQASSGQRHTSSRHGHGLSGHGTQGPGEHRGHMGHGLLYDVLSHLVFGGRKAHVFARLGKLSGARPGDRVLDVGCGTGFLTRSVARRIAPDGSVIGIDPSEDALTRARRTTRLLNCSFKAGQAAALDYPDASYDVVVSSLVMHHLPDQDRARALAEMFRVLRPGGRVLVAEFQPPSHPIVKRLMRPVMSPAMENNPVLLLEPMLGASGFEQVTSGNIPPWIRFVAAVKPQGTGS